MIAIGDKDRWHLQIADRWVAQYNFYINDRVWGRMFVRICLSSILRPGLPQSASLAGEPYARPWHRIQTTGQCLLEMHGPRSLAETRRLAHPAGSRDPRPKWLARLTPFFTASEREHAGCQRRLFFSQVEFCDNLIFHRRSALDKLGERLLDANRTIGQPDKITVIFGRKITKHYRGKLQTEIEDMNLPNPVIRSHYGNGFIKQYVRDHLMLHTEAASNTVKDYRINKAVENLPVIRNALSAINDNYLNVQQDKNCPGGGAWHHVRCARVSCCMDVLQRAHNR